MVWTRFMDMNSGGWPKLDWTSIYIEAPEDIARAIFRARFHRDPDYVTCNCCGQDYSVSESATLEQASGHDRNCDHDNTGYVERPRYAELQYYTVEEYSHDPRALILYAADLTPIEQLPIVKHKFLPGR